MKESEIKSFISKHKKPAFVCIMTSYKKDKNVTFGFLNELNDGFLWITDFRLSHDDIRGHIAHRNKNKTVDYISYKYKTKTSGIQTRFIKHLIYIPYEKLGELFCVATMKAKYASVTQAEQNDFFKGLSVAIINEAKLKGDKNG